jgi:carbamoylphosphate synthase small subunit
VDKFGIPRTFESSRIHAAALVVGEYSEEYSHWEASRSLGEWLREEGIPGITGAYISPHQHRLWGNGVV